jgi:hypothetical protein
MVSNIGTRHATCVHWPVGSRSISHTEPEKRQWGGSGAPPSKVYQLAGSELAREIGQLAANGYKYSFKE